jgi:NTP pyrophosphatase (non-canonical NTP hydrolase)
MNVWEMQARVAAFDAERFQSLGPGYAALNLAGEAGELANVIKKLWRADPRIGLPEGYAQIDAEHRERLADELADVLMLGLVLANHVGVDVEQALTRKLAVIDERLQAGYYEHEAKGRGEDTELGAGGSVQERNPSP